MDEAYAISAALFNIEISLLARNQQLLHLRGDDMAIIHTYRDIENAVHNLRRAQTRLDRLLEPGE